MDIVVENNPSEEKLESLGTKEWPIWEKEVSEFPWVYSSQEMCYFLEGEVEIIVDGKTAAHIKSGDFVVFPQGLMCTWKVLQPVKKHYRFS